MNTCIVISQAIDPVFIDTHLVLICTGSGVGCKKWERERLNILQHTPQMLQRQNISTETEDL